MPVEIEDNVFSLKFSYDDRFVGMVVFNKGLKDGVIVAFHLTVLTLLTKYISTFVFIHCTTRICLLSK